MADEMQLRAAQEDSPRTVTAVVGGGRDMTGYLMKRGRNLNMRHKRYITLRGRILSQHKDENSPPTWSVDVSKTRIQPGTRTLELLVHYEGKAVSFFAETDHDFNAWMDALRGASRTVEDWYQIGKQIGRGSYGVVHVGTDSRTGVKVAIKIIKKNPSSRRQSKFIEREVKILKSVNHKHVIKTMDVFENEEKLCLVSEFMEGGELFDRIIAEKFLTEEKARVIMQQLLEGVEYLHNQGIVHRDIKPENVLCARADWPYNIKVTDFGLSNMIEDGNTGDPSQALLSHVGTSYYLAPEVIGKKGYGAPVDMWACGIVLYIMLCGRFPFWGKTDIEFLGSVTKGAQMRGEAWAAVSDECKGFVRGLLQVDPSRRPTAKQALSSTWISSSSGGELRTLTSQAAIAESLNR